MFKQGQAQWYSYKTKKIYHAPDTHMYFVYNFKTKKVDGRKLNIFGIKREEITHILKKYDSEAQALPELKEWIINNGRAIRFGINTETIYFQVDKINKETLKYIKHVMIMFNPPPERIVTVEDDKKLKSYKTVDKFLSSVK